MPSAGDTLEDIVKSVVERRRESQRYLQDNYWSEIEDAQRAINCRVKPIYKKDRNGKDTKVEDKSRTNVCMPPLWLATRKKKARLTANAPHIEFDVPGDDPDMLGEQLTTLSYQQFDRSGEAQEHSRHVHQAVALGFSVTKLFWNKVQIVKPFKRYTESLDRRTLMGLLGAPPDEIEQATAALGDESDPELISQSIAKLGNVVTVPVDTTRYEGPTVKCIFFGDIDYDPRVVRFGDSDYHIETYEETDLWLEKMSKDTYIDPETKEEKPTCDPDALDKLADMGQSNTLDREQSNDLKTRLRAAVGKTSPLLRDKTLQRRKRFTIYEQHEADDSGRMWITYIGNEKIKIGAKPYPWDLEGRSCYTALTPMPNLISPIGDSSPRSLRHLHLLLNSSVGARKDLVAGLLRRTYILNREEDMPEEAFEKSYGKVLISKNMNPANMVPEPEVPASAFEEEAQILRMMALAEPSLNTTDTGTESNPMAGRLATTAILNAKSADALTEDEVKQVDLYFKEQGEKKLQMMQQVATEPIKISGKYICTEALSQKHGKTAMMEIDPYSDRFQQDIGVHPKAGSMLSVNDELKTQGIAQAYQISAGDPNWDRNYLAKAFARTLPGVDANKAVPPPQPPPPPFKGINFSITAKFEDLPSDVQNQILPMIQMQPSKELETRDTVKGVVQLGEAANAADTILSKPEDVKQQEQNALKIKNPPGLGKKKK